MKTTVLYIRSLGYSGSTWANLVLASHPDAFAVGVPETAFRYHAQGAAPCSVHGYECDFWPEFMRTWSDDDNYVLKIAEMSGRSMVVLNNAGEEFYTRHLLHPDVDLKVLRMTRDGRGYVTSALRHQPDDYEDAYHCTRTTFVPAMDRLANFPLAGRHDELFLRYEELVADPPAALAQVSALTGFDYPANAIRFWEFDHHFVNGNSGTVGMYKDLRGIPRRPHKREDYYRELVDYTRRNPDTPRRDDSWKELMSREDKLAFDYLAGELQAAYGYERPPFSQDEQREYRTRHNLPRDPAKAPKKLSDGRGLEGIIRKLTGS